LDIENLLGSKARIRILRVLLDKEELNITAIAREAGVSYKTALHHLEELKSMGVITEKVFGRVRVFRVNHDDLRVKALKEVFSSIGGLNGGVHGRRDQQG
jgi:DNA-binding transcriptional ArsR family regulator